MISASIAKKYILIHIPQLDDLGGVPTRHAPHLGRRRNSVPAYYAGPRPSHDIVGCSPASTRVSRRHSAASSYYSSGSRLSLSGKGLAAADRCREQHAGGIVSGPGLAHGLGLLARPRLLLCLGLRVRPPPARAGAGGMLHRIAEETSER